ncbi:MAG: hypothetical protein CMH98_03510 [Oceanospirillaceae bacterium]|nr:hypothetical protein [Oceanospirillaceae bacterium]
MRTVRESALLIALLFKRSEKTRARISGLTVKKLSKRERLKTAFVTNLTDELDDLGIVLVELDRGGFGLIYAHLLNGAPTVKAQTLLKNDLNDIKKHRKTFKDIENELSDGSNDDDDDNDDSF